MRLNYKILYILFIVVCVCYPYKFIVEPITIRHIFSLFMLGMCIYEGFRSDKYLYLYYIFIFCLGVSSFLTGYADIFFNKFLGTYLPIISAYASTYLLIKKYNGTRVLVWLFVVIGMLNALITIGQFMHMDFVDKLFTALKLDVNDEFVDKSFRRQSLEGFTVPGIMLDTVINGYFLSATALLVLYNKQSYFIINIILWVVVMLASLVAQERAGFFLAIAFSALIFGKYFFAKGKSIGYMATALFAVAVSFLIINYFEILFSSDLRFAKGFEADGRSELSFGAWNYLLSNPWGGFYEFDASENRHPHNFFMNAFLYGGIIGGTVLIVLLYKQIVKILSYIVKPAKSENAQWAFIWGLMYIDYTINSMVHNASIASGSFMFFVWWGAFLGFSDRNMLKKQNKLDFKMKSNVANQNQSMSL